MGGRVVELQKGKKATNNKKLLQVKDLCCFFIEISVAFFPHVRNKTIFFSCPTRTIPSSASFIDIVT